MITMRKYVNESSNLVKIRSISAPAKKPQCTAKATKSQTVNSWPT